MRTLGDGCGGDVHVSLMKKLFVIFLCGVMPFVAAARAAMPPQMGEHAPDFSLRTMDDRVVSLRTLTETAPVVLVVLRGWPGYQCPLCTKQVRDFVERAADFKTRGAQVVMIYPGPAQDLLKHASEFRANQEWPAEFLFLLDPDYTFTNAYGLRWEAKNETAYPSTFVVERGGKVRFAHVSKSHGGRTTAKQVLAELK